MIFLIGSSGIVSKQIQKIVPSKKIKIVSSKKKSLTIFTKIFKKRINEAWIKKITKKDTVIILSNFGSIKFYSKNKKKIKKYLQNFKKNFLNKINKKIKIIFMSTDMVYNGKTNFVYNDNSRAEPLNEYGKSKLYFENLIKKKFSKYLILRLSKIYSTKINDKTFVNSFFLDKKNYLFFDQKVHFLNIIDFSNILKKILKKKDLFGTFNVPGKLFCSRFQLAKILSKKKKKNVNIIKISVARKKYLPICLRLKTNLFKKIKYYPKF